MDDSNAVTASSEGQGMRRRKGELLEGAISGVRYADRLLQAGYLMLVQIRPLSVQTVGRSSTSLLLLVQSVLNDWFGALLAWPRAQPDSEGKD